MVDHLEFAHFQVGPYCCKKTAWIFGIALHDFLYQAIATGTIFGKPRFYNIGLETGRFMGGKGAPIEVNE